MKVPQFIVPLNASLTSSVDEVIRSTIRKCGSDDPFYVVDVADITRKHKTWTSSLPRVKPFYAVKCNPTPIMLETLAALGCGFDCASKAEIDSVLKLGVSPNSIIYANPCKTKSFIRHASTVGVNVMTFDNEQELYKVAEVHPSAKMVLRIKVDDSHSVCKFSAKFGAQVDNARHLLTTAKTLGLPVIGVSFHVGSGCESTESFDLAIRDARYVFDLAIELGMEPMTLLDLGGGWPGTSNPTVTFDAMSRSVRQALDEYFNENQFPSLKIIAEPGRYYAASAFTLATMVIAKRMIDMPNGERVAMYYLNDGVYGSFNCTIFDHWIVEPVPLNKNINDNLNVLINSTFWGPTCDSMDLIKKDVLISELQIGDWVVFREMGAYTIAAASAFNGFQVPSMKFFVPHHTLDNLMHLPRWPALSHVLELDDDDSTGPSVASSDPAAGSLFRNRSHHDFNGNNNSNSDSNNSNNNDGGNSDDHFNETASECSESPCTFTCSDSESGEEVDDFNIDYDEDTHMVFVH